MAGRMYFKWRSGLEFYWQKNKEIKTSKIEFVKIWIEYVDIWINTNLSHWYWQPPSRCHTHGSLHKDGMFCLMYIFFSPSRNCMLVLPVPSCALLCDTRQVSPSRPDAGEISSPPFHMPSLFTRDKEARPTRGEKPGNSTYTESWGFRQCPLLVTCEMSAQPGEKTDPNPVWITGPWHHWTEESLLTLAKRDSHLLTSYILPQGQERALARWALRFLACSFLAFLLVDKWLI